MLSFVLLYFISRAENCALQTVALCFDGLTAVFVMFGSKNMLVGSTLSTDDSF